MLDFPDNFLMFIIAAFIASAFPGVAVMGSFTTGLKQGFKSAAVFSLGLVSAAIFYFILSALGLVLLIDKYQHLFVVLKYLGIGYLLFLGIQSFREKDFRIDLTEVRDTHNYMALFISGFLIHLTNPKNLLFFVAVLPQYINTHQNINWQMFWLCLGSEVPEFLLLISYAYFAKFIKPFLMRPKVGLWFNKIIGALFVGLAFFLIFMH